MTRSRGFTLPEVLVAGVVLGVALTFSVQLTGSLRIKQREAQHRLYALTEAENWLQRLAATPWDELTPEHAAECRLSETAAGQLPAGELKIDVAALDEIAAGQTRPRGDPLARLAWPARCPAAIGDLGLPAHNSPSRLRSETMGSRIHSCSRRGMTLVEMVVVIAVQSILLATAVGLIGRSLADRAGRTPRPASRDEFRRARRAVPPRRECGRTGRFNSAAGGRGHRS